jgi:putative FmdB family regulatory protein
MPVCTYRCENCGVQFERTQKFVDAPLTRCPECNKKALRKVYSPVGIVFKCKGWYSTDHKSPSGQKWTSSGNSESENKPVESKTAAEGTSAEAKSGESKSSENKTGETKASESKTGSEKTGETAASKSSKE